MAVISIIYNEDIIMPDLGYYGIELDYNNKNRINSYFFNSGNFSKDWYNMWEFLINEGIADNEEVFYSELCQRFIANNTAYEAAYLSTENDGQGILKYLWNQENDGQISIPGDMGEIIANGVEFFVRFGQRPTWEEFKIQNQSI